MHKTGFLLTAILLAGCHSSALVEKVEPASYELQDQQNVAPQTNHIISLENSLDPLPLTWFHQLGGGTRAPEERFHVGDDLERTLRDTMEQLIKDETIQMKSDSSPKQGQLLQNR